MIRAVKQQTGATVHFITKAAFAATLKHNPYIDRLWTIKKDVSEIAEALTGQHFTHLIDLHGNLRSLEVKARLTLAAIKKGSRPPRTTTFNKLNWEKFLLTRLHVDRMPDLHIVDRYLAAARPLGVKNDGKGLDYFLAPEDAVNLAANGLPENFIAFVIGAAHATKRLEENQMAEICHRLPHPVILLGGPAEAEMGERIAATGERIYSACGKFSINGSADLVRQSRYVITHDTGLMHIAAAFQKTIVSVWGNTVPELGMYPYLPEGGNEIRREVKGLACRPCSKIGYDSCPQGHFKCIREQRVEDLPVRL